jgi:hypothetical protein
VSAGAIIAIAIAATGIVLMRFRKRWLAKFNIVLTNRITSLFAGWLPGFGILTHVHLVYFDHNKDRGSWVIRDFIAGQRLDDGHSALTVAQIETDATYDEFPVWCNVEVNPAEWRTYLKLRTTAVLRLSGPLGSTNAPNSGSGHWQPLV